MPGWGMDQDQDDVETMVPQPIFEFIKTPRLGAWSQASIAKYLRDRKQYEIKIEERCTVASEVKKDAFQIKDEDLLWEMKCKAGTMVTSHVPDVQQLFARELHMDLKEVDIEARIAMYFMAFEHLVEKHGLLVMLGRGPATDASGKQRLEMRCKLLLQNVAPEMLRVDLGRQVDFTHRDAEYDDVKLHGLTVERATHQQRYHLIQSESKRGDRVKRVTGDGDTNYQTVSINGVLEVPFCPDTGSDINIIGKPTVEELKGLIGDLVVIAVDPPVRVQVAGGSKESLFGRGTLENISIDLNLIFEQLAQRTQDDLEADSDDTANTQARVIATGSSIRRSSSSSTWLCRTLPPVDEGGAEPNSSFISSGNGDGPGEHSKSVVGSVSSSSMIFRAAGVAWFENLKRD
ncbi:hypothetical protein FI667_g7043, partial [Globisporangium splendens]